MKKLVLFSLLLLVAGVGFSQVKNPVKWTFSSKKLPAGTYELKFTATIQPSWHIYSQNTPDGGPSATVFSFTKNPLVTLDGPAKEIGKLEQKFEALFGVEVKQFSDKVEFVQVVKPKGKAKTAVKGQIKFMTCNDRECLPPTTQKFSINL